MEQTAFQQKLEELKRIKEQRRLEALRQKYSTAPDFSNMNLHDELKVRFDLDELEQLEKKFALSELSTGIKRSFISGQTQTPVGKILQNTKYMNNSPKPVSFTDIAVEGLKGFGEGIENGTLTAMNAATGGIYNFLDYSYLGGGYEKQQQELQRRTETVGLGGANKLANLAIERGVNGLMAGKTIPDVWKKLKYWR